MWTPGTGGHLRLHGVRPDAGGLGSGPRWDRTVMRPPTRMTGLENLTIYIYTLNYDISLTII